MSLISEDLMHQSQHKTKGFSKEFLQRYLTSIVDFIKIDLETAHCSNGRIEDSDKAILLSKAWAALQPSSLEGWGITVI